MSPISAAYSPEASNISPPTVKAGVTSQEGMTDNTQRNDIRNDIHSLIADAQAYITSMNREQTCTPIVEMPKASQLPASEFEDLVMRRFSQTALQSIRSVLSGETMVFTAELSKMANLQFDLSQLCLRNYQSGLEANKNELHDLSLKNIEKLQEAIDQAAKSKAEQEKMGFWGKLSNILGMAAAIAGILLAPLTGGLSLLATGYLAVDLGLQIGEQTTGIKMSIESGLKKGIKAFLMALPHNVLSESQCDFIAGIVGSIVGMVLAVGMSVLSAGSNAPKIFSALLNFEKALKHSHKVSRIVQAYCKIASMTDDVQFMTDNRPSDSMIEAGLSKPIGSDANLFIIPDGRTERRPCFP